MYHSKSSNSQQPFNPRRTGRICEQTQKITVKMSKESHTWRESPVKQRGVKSSSSVPALTTQLSDTLGSRGGPIVKRVTAASNWSTPLPPPPKGRHKILEEQRNSSHNSGLGDNNSDEQNKPWQVIWHLKKDKLRHQNNRCSTTEYPKWHAATCWRRPGFKEPDSLHYHSCHIYILGSYLHIFQHSGHSSSWPCMGCEMVTWGLRLVEE